MKKSLKLVVGVILCLSMLLSFVSCQYVDEFLSSCKNDAPLNEETIKDTNDTDNGVNIVGDKQNTEEKGYICPCLRTTEDGYTGGLTDSYDFHLQYGVYWLETYDEVLDAIQLLKSHGSTVGCTLGFDYDGELFDVKYCFVYYKKNAEPHEEDKNFFDRCINGGKFYWYGFYNDITIDELMYNTIVEELDTAYFEKCYDFYTEGHFDYEIAKSVDNPDDLSFYWDWGDGIYKPEPTAKHYDIFYRNEYFATLFFERSPLLEEYHKELLNTFTVIE